MRLLVLGGNVFVGRAIVKEAMAQGHEVTTFTRGQSGRCPAGVVSLHGDRLVPGGMAALHNTEWDAVVDVCRQAPRQVDAAIAALKGRVDTYVFVSTTSVYADLTDGPVTEDSPVVDAMVEAEDATNYPGLKVRSEQIVREGFPDGFLVVRPGLIVGPGDPTDRFTYWVRRGSQPGPILAPGRPDRRIRFTDVRDLAAWIVFCAARRLKGTFNAVGPADRMSMAQLLEACLVRENGLGEDVRWVPDELLLEQGVAPYSDLPLWVPEVPEYAMFAEIDSRLAEDNGLDFRPVAETIAATRTWAETHRPEALRAGLTRDEEERLLAL